MAHKHLASRFMSLWQRDMSFQEVSSLSFCVTVLVAKKIQALIMLLTYLPKRAK